MSSSRPSAGGWALYYGNGRSPLATVIPDLHYLKLFRIRWPSGRLSRLFVLSLAKDAALAVAERGPPRRHPKRFRWEVRESSQGASGKPQNGRSRFDRESIRSAGSAPGDGLPFARRAPDEAPSGFSAPSRGVTMKRANSDLRQHGSRLARSPLGQRARDASALPAAGPFLDFETTTRPGAADGAAPT